MKLESQTHSDASAVGGKAGERAINMVTLSVKYELQSGFRSSHGLGTLRASSILCTHEETKRCVNANDASHYGAQRTIP